MSGIDRIKERILEDARKNAAVTLEEAEKKAYAYKEKKTVEANTLKSKLLEENQIKAIEKKKRMLSVAELELRKGTLGVKQELIDHTFSRVLDAYEKMPQDQYQSVIEDILLKSVVKGDEEIVISNSDAKRLDKAFLDKINARIKKEKGLKGNLKISENKGDFKGGFIIKSGGVEMNNTFTSMLRMIRDDIEPQVAELLFSKEQ